MRLLTLLPFSGIQAIVSTILPNVIVDQFAFNMQINNSTNFLEVCTFVENHKDKYISYNNIYPKIFPILIDEKCNTFTHTFINLKMFILVDKDTIGNISIKLCYDYLIHQEFDLNEVIDSLNMFITSNFNKNYPICTISPLSKKQQIDQLKKILSTQIQTKHRFVKTLQQAFEDTVRQFPDNIAVEFGNNKITYTELDTQATNISNFLLSSNYHADLEVVAIYSDPSIAFIAAIIGCLKAGKTLLALDPKIPDIRIKELLIMSEASVVLIQSQFKKKLDQLSNIQSYIIETVQQKTTEDQLTSVNNTKFFQNEIAYIIYTSGSTGIPKGVKCTHLGALNMIYATIDQYPVLPNDRLLYLASCSFDIAIWEIFCPLLAGGTLIVPEIRNLYSDVANIVNYIKHKNITILHMVPSVLQYFIKCIDKKNGATLRTIVSGGEGLTTKIAGKLLKILPDCQLYHGYGPTETAITAIHHKIINKEDMQYGVYVPIGTLIPNLTAVIINSQSQILPTGVFGELLIGGIGVAQGYLKAEEKTKMLFINFTVAGYSLGSCYKTGDIVRRLRNGIYQFSGRKDSQIKINGLRIELLEIENVINTQTKSESIVIVKKSVNQLPILIAFVVYKLTDEEKAGFISNLKEKLLEKLPQYMQPHEIFFIDELPRLSSDKIDRNKLLGMTTSSSSYEFISYNPVEQQIKIYLSQLTSIGNFDASLSFFSLGFNSLVLTQLTAFINDQYSTLYSVDEIIRQDNVRALSFNILSAQPTVSNVKYCEIKQISRNEALELSHAQKRLWFVHMVEEQESYIYNIINAFKISKNLNIQALESALSYIVFRHESLRTLFKHSFGQPHQVILTEQPIQLKIVDVKFEDADVTIKAFCKHSFKLDKEVSCMFRLYDIVDEDYYILVILQHNIITDGWSAGVLIRDLSETYNSILENREPNLPYLQFQYVDYADWQNTMIRQNAYEKQVIYWKEVLSDYNELDFPTTYLRQPRQTFVGKTINFTLNNIDEILEFCKNKRLTLYTYLITSLNLLLYQYTDQTDILIGSGAANRGITTLKDVMGFFVNVFAIRTKFNTSSTIQSLIDNTKKACIGAISNQDVPFDILVDQLNIEREPHKSPLFQILFLMQDAADNTLLKLKDCLTSTYDIVLDGAIYDITFNVYREGSYLTLACQYNTDLFSDSFIEDFLRHYKKVIQDIYQYPLESKIDSYSLLESEDINVINSFNASIQTDISYTPIDLFLQQVSFSSGAHALTDENGNYSYKNLFVEASAIAKTISNETEQQDFVVIISSKDKGLVVSMLACMLANRIYIPVTIDTPKIRLESIIKQAGVKLIIENKCKIIPSSESVKVIDLQSITTSTYATQQELDYLLKSFKQPQKLDNIVYSIFTSGSTGEPKGVKITCSNLSNVISHFVKTLSFSNKSSFLSLTSISFDIFQLEWLLPLTTGAICYLVTTQTSGNLNMVKKFIYKYHPTHIQATPSIWKMFIDQHIDFNSIANTSRIMP